MSECENSLGLNTLFTVYITAPKFSNTLRTQESAIVQYMWLLKHFLVLLIAVFAVIAAI